MNVRLVTAKQIVMSDKSLRTFSVFVITAVNVLRDQAKVISYEAVNIKYYI